VRLNHRAKRGPRDDLLHRRQEHIALGWPAVLFVLRVLVGGHGQGQLLHAMVNAPDLLADDLISVSLVP